MPTLDQSRIDADRAAPRVMQLWWALRPLQSTVRFMNSGAHPDDETTAMLAAIGLRDGINLSYACSTRGEGGQNDIGTEGGADLGALRTREMERACDVLGMRLYWHSESAEDPITDFGFSKSGVETLAKWGAERTLARFVEIVRTDRPDILCPTFLDIPGQHGHHRAMTQAAHEVMAAAADPAFPSNLAPWQVRKLYLPAWSGAGQAYDDDLPPPPATLTVDATGTDPMSGWSWSRIAQQSRAYHRTQGMGRWVPAREGQHWPLHLAESHISGSDDSLIAGLPATVGALADLPGATRVAAQLRDAQIAIETALAAFPAFDAVADAARAALSFIEQARTDCPEAVRDEVEHRLAAKADQLGHVLRHASGVELRARTRALWLHPGDTTELDLEFDGGDGSATYDLDLPVEWHLRDGEIQVGGDASPSEPYRDRYDPLVPDAPALVLDLGEGVARLPFEAPPVVLPSTLADVSPARTVINLATPDRRIEVGLAHIRPTGAEAALHLPDGWHAIRTDAGFEVDVPDHAPEGVYEIPLSLGGAPAMSVRRMGHAHVDATARAVPSVVRVLVTRVELPKARVGYIGSGHDQVAQWLDTLGMDVTPLSDADLTSESSLAGFDCIVVGIFAMRFRTGLVEAMPRLHAWTEAGGTLVTLYHRPWDNWDPDKIPPRRLEIGQPSLRWRVTDEAAEVTPLANHPILSIPNAIGPETWTGWVKERGLYFAKSWDAAYTPLLEMADPEEDPHRGALLVADVGAGRHVHTSLILHHQMAQLVPGAFRLMANLVAPRA